MADTNCDSVVIIRLLANDLFRIYFRGTQPLLNPETYDLVSFRKITYQVFVAKVESAQCEWIIYVYVCMGRLNLYA